MAKAKLHVCDMVVPCYSPLVYMYVTLAHKESIDYTYTQDLMLEVTDSSGTEREYCTDFLR